MTIQYLVLKIEQLTNSPLPQGTENRKALVDVIEKFYDDAFNDGYEAAEFDYNQEHSK